MSRPPVVAKNFKSFADLAAVYVEGVDYRMTRVSHAEASVAVVAPHCGGIETHTSEIATAVAGEEFSLYLLEEVAPLV